MKNGWRNLSIALCICALIVLCVVYGGHRLITHWLSDFATDAPLPAVDSKNLLTIEQFNDFYPHEEAAARICYDDTGFYFLRGSQLCYAQKPGECEAVYTAYDASEVASWGDKLVIYGGLDQETSGFIILDKNNLQGEAQIYPVGWSFPVTFSNGQAVDIKAFLPPIRWILYEGNQNIPFETLTRNTLGYRGNPLFSLEDWNILFGAFDVRMESRYQFGNAKTNWFSKAGSWLYWFSKYKRYDGYYIKDGYYVPAQAQFRQYIPYTTGQYNDLCLYDGSPYLIESKYERFELECEPSYKQTKLIPPSQSGKPELPLYPAPGFFLRRSYADGQGRMRYFVFSGYTAEMEQNHDDRYDTQFLTGHKILAADLETMQQTRELTLATPREQVLYVNEAGAYTWRHDESRVFFIPWQGEAVAVSEPIPYAPRYETPEDEKQGDACNRWYAEVDRDRLLLFDMTQGETALLAVVELPY